MPDKVVYRSTHPDVIAHWESTASAETRNAWRQKVEAAVADLGFPGRRFATQDGRKVIGVEYPNDEDMPAGWRRNRNLTSSITPDRRTANGRRIRERLDALTAPCPRENLPGKMPDTAFSRGFGLMKPGVARHGDAVYVTWSEEIDKGDAAHIDPTVWQRIKLSEYYAALEAEEAKAS
jgi:hypothetical protein